MDKKTRRNTLLLGVLTILAVGVFFWGLYYLLGSPVLRGGMDVVVALENGGGVKRGDRVLLQGVEVGSVRDIELLGHRGVAVTLRLNDKIPLPADTRASVSGDVFGAHTVDLMPGGALVKLEKGDTLRGVNAQALTEAAADLTVSARGVLTRADSLLSPEAIANLHATTAILPGSAEQLRLAFVELRLASTAMRRTVEAFEAAQTGTAMSAAIGRVDESAQAMTAVAASMERSLGSLQAVFGKIDGGEGTLGRLVNDTSLYAELTGAARDVRALAADMKANPNRYITVKIF